MAQARSMVVMGAVFAMRELLAAVVNLVDQKTRSPSARIPRVARRIILGVSCRSIFRARVRCLGWRRRGERARVARRNRRREKERGSTVSSP